MFRVKICGITSIDDARMAVEAGADAIGLNFFQGSPRHCSIEQAAAIAAVVPTGVCKVGVFVNAPADEIRRVAMTAGLDLVQLHGDEPPELLRQIRPLPVMRAFRAGNGSPAIDEYLRSCYRLMCVPRMLLIDAAVPGEYGGTGTVLDWQALAKRRVGLCGLPLVLAGGLKPSNVAAAIAAVRPWAVDVASGVEVKPGQKSAELTREFIACAKAALAQAATQR